MSLRIARPGFAAVQDLGRAGLEPIGVPGGGAFDEWALRRGNRLCGNDADAAAIEFVLAGPEINFEHAHTVVLTGADFDASLDGMPVARDVAFEAPEGAVLRIGKARRGARGYLCVAGGIATEPVLASRSVSARAGIGVMLAGGDRLPVAGPVGRPRSVTSRAASDRTAAIRVVLGPQPFPEQALAVLLSESFTVTPDADRVGVRLDGPALPGGGEIDPEPAVPGAIQVPGSGQPIVLGPDGPVTGGYPKIATVIRADLWVFAQARPGDRLTFERCDPAVARRALAARLREG